MAFVKGYRPWNIGLKGWRIDYITSQETKDKISRTLTGRKNPEHSARMKGRTAWNKNKKRYWITPGDFRKGEHTGDKNINWKGDFTGYVAMHKWVSYHKGKPTTCEHCGKTGLVGCKIHWANIDHKYKRNLDDYIRLCTSCHQKYDTEHNNYINGRGWQSRKCNS